MSKQDTGLQIGLERAIRFAAECHRDQFDKADMPYILHPLWVMRKMMHFGLDYAILGVCHDAIEDKFRGDPAEGFARFRNDVINDISIEEDLSRLTRASNDSYRDYIRGIAGSERAKKVKMADLEHNSRITRLKGLRQKDFDRMRKYSAAYAYLAGDPLKLMDLMDDV